MKPWFVHLPPGSGARAIEAIATIAMAMVLASCSLSRPAPVKHMYLLDPAMPPAGAAPTSASVRIGVINVAAPFRGRALVYRRDDLTFEADFYSEYFVVPAVMMAEATAKALTAANVYRRVVPPGAAPDDADYVLDGFVSELYGDMREAGKPAAVLAATFYLSTASTPSATVLWSREYRQRVALTDASPDALARAWNTALSAMLADLARDLAAVPLPKT